MISDTHGHNSKNGDDYENAAKMIQNLKDNHVNGTFLYVISDTNDH